MSLKEETTQLLAILRRRYGELEQAYQKLANYTRSLEIERATLHERILTLQTDLREWQADHGARFGRTVGQFSRNLKQNVALTAGLLSFVHNHSIEAHLDEPQPHAAVNDEIVVSGWATSSAPDTMQIDIRLNGSLLGQADYNLERWDVVKERPWQGQVDCGFAGRFNLNTKELKAGPAVLSVTFNDGRSAGSTIERSIIIGLPEPSEHESLYKDWIARTKMRGWDFLQQRAISQKWGFQPIVSLLLALEVTTAPDRLAELLASILNQTYFHWEVRLLLPEQSPPALRDTIETYLKLDSRVQVVEAIAEEDNFNTLLKAAKGEYIALPEADALLGQDALFQIVHFLQQHQDAGLIYSDEDYLDEAAGRSQPQFKPDWSPALFYARPYIGQLTFYHRSAVREVGGFRSEFGEAQVYDLTLRLLKQSISIHHLPEVIYHGRHSLDLARSLGVSYKYALENYFQRAGKVAVVEPGILPGSWHCRFPLESTPSISIIVPTRDQSEILRRCLDSIMTHTTYPNYKIVVVDNASHQRETHRYLAELAAYPRVRCLTFDGPFNYSAINNFAVAQLQSDLLVFLNNDTEVISPNWLEEMVAYAVQPQIGAVGARLLYPNDTVQHAGVVVGVLGVADHILKGLPATQPGYLGLAKTVKNVSALTAACLMTRRELFWEVGGFDEQNLPVAFNDVDYCLKLREKGLELVWTPYAELYHYEALSRGVDVSIEKENRLYQEITTMFGRWPGPIASDPYYNPNLSLDRLDYAITTRLKQPNT